MNINIKYQCCGALIGALISCAALAEVSPEQIHTFLNRVPEWGEPAIGAAQQEQYDAEVAAAQRYRYASHHHHHHHHHDHGDDHGPGHRCAGYGTADGFNGHCGREYH